MFSKNIILLKNVLMKNLSGLSKVFSKCIAFAVKMFNSKQNFLNYFSTIEVFYKDKKVFQLNELFPNYKAIAYKLIQIRQDEMGDNLNIKKPNPNSIENTKL